MSEVEEPRFSTAQVEAILGNRSRKLIWDWVHWGLFRPGSLDGGQSQKRKAWWSLQDVWEAQIASILRTQKVPLYTICLALNEVRRHGKGAWDTSKSLVIAWDKESQVGVTICANEKVLELGLRFRLVTVPLFPPNEEDYRDPAARDAKIEAALARCRAEGGVYSR